MKKIKVFLASSAELKGDRTEFEIFINRKNKDWVDRGIFLELIVWEDFLDAVSRTRLQDEYNQAIRGCDLFVMLFWTKVGKYTQEEFETAFGQFKANDRPFIFTYFKDAEISTSGADRKDFLSLFAFQEKLDALGHFYTIYKNADALKHHFNQQLDKLAAKGFIEFSLSDTSSGEQSSHQANLTGIGTIVQGRGTALAAGGVYVGGGNSGTINTGTQITTGTISGSGINIGHNVQPNTTRGISPHDLAPLFSSAKAAIMNQGCLETQNEALRHLEDLQAEILKGKDADDGRMAKILDGLAGMLPSAVRSVADIFVSPVLSGIAGPITKFVLDKFQPN